MKIAIISDIHSNLHAFKKVLKHIKKQKVDKIISLGDNIDYGGQPNEVTELIRNMEIPSVLGNHELALFDSSERSRYIGIAESSLYRSIELLSMDNYNYYRNLEPCLEFEGIRFVHGVPPDDCITYLYELESSQLVSTFNSIQNKLCFIGHSHIPAVAEFNGEKVISTEIEESMILYNDCRYIINPGSVGQPRNGNPDASYMLFDTEKLFLQQIYVKYNIDLAAKDIFKNGFPAYNAERLYLGC